MDYTQLGRSGLLVSRAALGTMNFGTGAEGLCDEADATRIIGAFLDAGGNLLDTADIYNDGESERIVGRAIAGRREEVVLATKGGGPRAGGPNATGLSRLQLTGALEASLRRLDVDHIDLYQCHVPDPVTPAEETMSALDDFVRSGKVRYVGCSNFTVGQIYQAQWAAANLAATGFVSLQSHYSLLVRAIEAEILPACEHLGLGTITYGPLASGLLAGRYRKGDTPEPGTRMHQWLHYDNPAAGQWVSAMTTDRNYAIAAEVEAVAAELDATAAAVALAWIIGRPWISSVILGPRTLDQLSANLDGTRLDLPADQRRRLDDISAPSNAPVTGVPIAFAS